MIYEFACIIKYTPLQKKFCLLKGTINIMAIIQVLNAIQWYLERLTSGFASHLILAFFQALCLCIISWLEMYESLEFYTYVYYKLEARAEFFKGSLTLTLG